MKWKILIWGTGYRAERYLKCEYFKDCEIIGFTDTYKKSEHFYGYKVYDVKEVSILSKEVDYLIVASQYWMEIFGWCLANGIKKDKIIFSDYIDEVFFENNLEIARTISVEFYNDIIMNHYKLIKVNERDLFDKERLTGAENYNRIEYSSDYFRYRTFEFVANELIENKVEGAVAELGVFRGIFAALINRKFSDRHIFLFDTFEGFDKCEAKREIELGRCDESFAEHHSRTSVERALSILPYPEQAIVCKGFFPESLNEVAKNTKYAFVSIDVDFEESIYQGLKFFYPMLSEGGVIFLHDYNSAFLGGVREAVKRYEKNENIVLRKVPIADRAGTLIIMK